MYVCLNLCETCLKENDFLNLALNWLKLKQI